MDSRKQVHIPGNFRDALDVWRKEKSMSWNEFGEFLSQRADEIFAREGVVRKFFMIEPTQFVSGSDRKIRKSITVSEAVMKRLGRSRKLARLGWNDFFLWMLEQRDAGSDTCQLPKLQSDQLPKFWLDIHISVPNSTRVRLSVSQREEEVSDG